MWPGPSVIAELMRKKARALPQRRSEFSLADEMNAIREFYGHTRPPVVLLCAQHLNLFSMFGEF